MNKSILVLDENSVIHGLVTSALETEGLTLHHEFNPGQYVERATSLMPDLILLGNSERDPGYEMARRIKSGELSEVPMVLLAASRESMSRDQLQRLRVDGVVRKPFEASDLQQQVSKHLNLVDLIGSAYEYRQAQSTADEGANPLTNLDVLDDEVLGLLRGTAPLGGGAAPAPTGQPRPVGGAPVVDDEVLAETLQPERAFERLDQEPSAAGTRFDSLETLEGEFPSQALELPRSESELDELGAADVLEEEAPEETVLEPQGFDQDLDGGAQAHFGAPLDEIEVELGEDLANLQDSAMELAEGEVDLFESDLASMEPREESAFEESIPLSVRRMMELKPVFTMTQEESAAEEDVLEPFDFEPDAAEVEAIQQDLDELGEVPLEDEELETQAASVREQELEFASPTEVRALEDDLEPPEDFDLSLDSDLPPLARAAAEPEPLDEAPSTIRVEERPGEALEFDDLGAAEIGDELESEEEPNLEPEPAPEPAPAPRGDTLESEPVRAAPATDEQGEADDDFFIDEYLGDEEIDEDQIIAADEDEFEDQPELSPEDEAELDELLAEDEHLGDLEDYEDLDADEFAADEAAEEEVELEPEEEDMIFSAIEAERGAPESGAEEPLFERNFNSLAEEPSGESGEEDSETWQLEQEDGGFALADHDPAPAGEGAEVIQLHTPEPDDALELAEMEEVPASALEEIEDEPLEAVSLGDAREEPLEAVSLGDARETFEDEPLEAVSLGDAQETFEDEPLEAVPLEEEEPVSIEFGEGEGNVFEEESESWRPKTPSSFVGQPAENFPEDVVREPFVGPESEPEEEHPSPSPRHAPEEVLEDPDSLAPVLDEEAGGEEWAAAADLADGVLPHELDAEAPDALEAEEDFAATPLSALADHALGAVEEPAAPEPAAEEFVDERTLDDELGLDESGGWEEEQTMGDAFEPVDLDAEEPASSASLTRGEMDALIGGKTGESEADLEALLGGSETLEEAAPGQAAAAADRATGDAEFDDLFSSLRDEIAANPEGERLDDVLRRERIRDLAAGLEFALPQHESSFARVLGVYELAGDGEGPSAFPAAFGNGGGTRPAAAGAAPAPAARPAAPPVPPEAPSGAPTLVASAADASALSLLDPDIRAKLGQVLDEIISISVRKAVQEEMPRIMERLSRNP